MVSEAQKIFHANKNDELAHWMVKYMKGKFPYFGIKAPLRNQISKPLYTEAKKMSKEDFFQTIEQLWNLDEREFQYLAIELLKKNVKKLDIVDLPFVRKLIVTKSWWDTVDSIASNTLGSILLKDESSRKIMDNWIKDDNLWIRRSAIIHQLKYKEKTNEDQLFGHCLLTCHEKDFFIRKAIGWALRQHSKLYPNEVKQFVESNEEELSNLSKKEALRNIS